MQTMLDAPAPKRKAARKKSYVQLQLADLETKSVFECVKKFKGDEGFEPAAPARATSLQPGPEKVETLARRVANGESLWHEDDAVVVMKFQMVAELLGTELEDLS